MGKILTKIFFILSVLILLNGNAYTASDKNDSNLTLTLYNQDLTHVYEIRKEIELKKGNNTWLLKNIPDKIDLSSIMIEVMNEDKKMTCQLISQEYKYDFADFESLLSKYIMTKKIEIQMRDGKFLEGYLIKFEKNYIFFGKDEEDTEPVIIDRSYIENIKLPENPNGLITKPSVFLTLKSSHKEDYDISFSYITNGINHKTMYNALVDQSESQLLLSGNISVNNNSGINFDNAKLKLGIGNITPRSSEIPVFYLFEDKVSLKNNSTQSFSLFSSPKKIKFNKIFTYNSSLDNKNVKIAVSFINKEENGLGIRLPGGKIKLFEKDQTGIPALIREDEIQDLYPGTETRLVINNDLDISALRRQTETKKISSEITEKVFEIEIKNDKKEQVNIFVTENIEGKWEISDKTDSFIIKGPSAIEFSVLVPPQDKKIIQYRVQINN